MGIVKVLRLSPQSGKSELGQKSLNLQWLAKNGWRVPTTFILPGEISNAYQRDPVILKQQLRILLEKNLKIEQAYAVRSSANLEDSHRHSYAGQFRSFLNLSSMEHILGAVEEVLVSAQSAGVRSYAQKVNLDINDLHVAVIIQEMVTPVISGVAFSNDPLTGLDETVIEAVEGLGLALVQEGRTPLRWVNKWGSWMSKPDTCTIDEQLIATVAVQTQQIARQYGSPVDLEWVYDGLQLYWVQLRPITGLDRINIYSNRISKEMFPGIIKPLIWTVNVPLVNSAWIELLTKLIGPNDLQPEELAKDFAYRAYFNMGMFGQILATLGMPKETLELLLGLDGGSNRPRFRPSRKTFMLLHRLIPFIMHLLKMGPYILPSLAEIRKAYTQLQEIHITELDEAGLLSIIDRLYALNQKASRFSIIVPILLNIYFVLFRRQLAKHGVDIIELDLTAGLIGLDSYDPNLHINRLALSYNQLDMQAQTEINACVTYAEFLKLPGIAPFKNQMLEFLSAFGYMSDRANDFSAIPWRETPYFVLKMVLDRAKQMKSVVAQDHPLVVQPKKMHHPDDRQTEKRQFTWDTLPIQGIQRTLLKPIYGRVRQFRLYREAVSATYSYGYGLFRPFFIELGNRLHACGGLDLPEDIFYLRWEEIKSIILEHTLDPSRDTTSQTLEIVSKRKKDIAASQDIELPEIIFGDELPPIFKTRDSGNTLKGIASSRGYYQGRAKIIKSIGEFSKLDAGDVLVISYSDVSWTPLFSRAGAVIAESGGILSHSSIVAREYQIPAVVSVPGAMHLRDHMLVTVDGYRGEVILHNE
jgi:pyruvate,water dikinase